MLSHTDPQRAGAVSGALLTMQQVGNALGVAVTGLLFFGGLDGGYASAFERSLLQLACLAVAVAALTGLLPGPGAPGFLRRQSHTNRWSVTDHARRDAERRYLADRL